VDEVATGRTVVIRQIESFEKSFSSLLEALDHFGMTLGFGYSFIATGEVGPSFYALEKSGQPLAQLSVEYETRAALENAWLSFKKMAADVADKQDK
jgi:hypothetical protein